MDSKIDQTIDTLMGYMNMYLKITANYVNPTNFLVKNACRAFHPTIPNQCVYSYQFFSVHWKNRLISCKKLSMIDIVPASHLKPQSPTAVLFPVCPSHFSIFHRTIAIPLCAASVRLPPGNRPHQLYYSV